MHFQFLDPSQITMKVTCNSYTVSVSDSLLQATNDELVFSVVSMIGTTVYFKSTSVKYRRPDPEEKIETEYCCSIIWLIYHEYNLTEYINRLPNVSIIVTWIRIIQCIPPSLILRRIHDIWTCREFGFIMTIESIPK